MTRKLTPLETYANAIAQLANAIDEWTRPTHC